MYLLMPIIITHCISIPCTCVYWISDIDVNFNTSTADERGKSVVHMHVCIRFYFILHVYILEHVVGLLPLNID